MSISSIANHLKKQLIVTKILYDAPRRSVSLFYKTGINLWVKRTRGRAKKGERAIRVVAGRRGKNLTMTFAVCPFRGLIFHHLMEGGMTCVRFEDVILNLCAQNPLGPNESPCVLIIDNEPAHNQAGNINFPPGYSIKYFPTHSPFLNIAENAINMWKSAVKNEMTRARDQLNQEPYDRRMQMVANIAEMLTPAITPVGMTNSFRHTQSYLPRCLDLADILY